MLSADGWRRRWRQGSDEGDQVTAAVEVDDQWRAEATILVLESLDISGVGLLVFILQVKNCFLYLFSWAKILLGFSPMWKWFGKEEEDDTMGSRVFIWLKLSSSLEKYSIYLFSG